MSFNLDSICVIALFFKLFKYAQLHPSTSMLFSVLVRSGGDIGFFLVLLFVLLAAFSFCAMQFFGTFIEEYTTIFKCVLNLTLVLLGQFDVAEMKQANPTFGELFFVIYIVTMFLIMMNIFLAILGEAYSVTRANSEAEKARQPKKVSRGLGDWIKLARAVAKAKMAQRKLRKKAAAAEKQGALMRSIGGSAAGKKPAQGSSTRELVAAGHVDSGVREPERLV
jgi:hypothetical protein